MKTTFAVLMGVLLFPAVSFAAFNVDLRYGSSGAEVFELQEFLTAEGVYTGPITGNFYSLTLAGVKAFQTKEGVQPVSGFFGPLTRAKANARLAVELEESDKEASTTPKVVTPDKPRTSNNVSNNDDDEDNEDDNFVGAVSEPPTIDVDISYSRTDFDGNEDDDGPGRKFVLVKVTGKWDKARIHMWDPTGAQVLGGQFIEQRELEGDDGLTRDVNNAPTGEYRWEVTARLGDEELTETGTFVAQ